MVATRNHSYTYRTKASTTVGHVLPLCCPKRECVQQGPPPFSLDHCLSPLKHMGRTGKARAAHEPATYKRMKGSKGGSRALHCIIMSMYDWQGAMSPPVFLMQSWKSCVSFPHCIPGAAAAALVKSKRTERCRTLRQLALWSTYNTNMLKGHTPATGATQDESYQALQVPGHLCGRARPDAGPSSSQLHGAQLPSLCPWPCPTPHCP
jgi:hypothetical protein